MTRQHQLHEKSLLVTLVYFLPVVYRVSLFHSVFLSAKQSNYDILHTEFGLPEIWLEPNQQNDYQLSE